MANLVIKSNTANKAFSVQQKIFRFPLDDNKVELLITPKKLYSINSKDFNAGLLPPQILKIEFSNIGEKIVASIFIKQKINTLKDIVLNVPISGKGFLKIDRFNIIEKVNSFGEVLITDLSPNPKSTINNKTKHIIQNDLGKKSLVLSKTFAVTEGFKFSKLPTYSISGNSSRYNVITKTKKDNENNIINKTFDFYYTSPSVMMSSADAEVNFSVSTTLISSQNYNEVATSVKQNKIYSINKGVDPGSEGGSKRIVVKGVPGSTFSFLVSNSSGEMYDTNTGTFSNSGGLIAGIIPKALKNKSFGESVIRINVPRSATAQTISTQFFKQEDVAVQKAKLAQAATVAEIEKIAGDGKIKKTKSLSLTTPTLTFKVTTTNYLGPKVKIISSGVTTTSQLVFLGKEGREELAVTKPGTYRFSFTVSSAADNKVVQITRQPLFAMPTAPNDNYVAWDSDETKKILAQKADGTKIPSDWDWSSVESNTNIKMRMQCRGVGKILSTDDISGIEHYSYAQVNVFGEISVGNVGEASSNLSLRLDNFLSVIS